MALRAASRYFVGMATNMTAQVVFIGVKRERDEATGATGRPAAILTESRTGATSTVVKDQCLITTRECIFQL
ncbi:hypothetical protein D3C72_2125540 [compost metagenome]